MNEGRHRLQPNETAARRMTMLGLRMRTPPNVDRDDNGRTMGAEFGCSLPMAHGPRARAPSPRGSRR